MDNSQETATCEVILEFFRLKRKSFQASFVKSSQWSSSEKHKFMHWAANFKFANGEAYTLEAVEDGNGRLKGMLSNSAGFSPPEEQISLGQRECTFLDVMQAFRRVQAGEYKALSNNCQTWVLALLEILNIEIPENVKSTAHWIASIFTIHGEEIGFKCVVSQVKAAFKFASK